MNFPDTSVAILYTPSIIDLFFRNFPELIIAPKRSYPDYFLWFSSDVKQTNYHISVIQWISLIVSIPGHNVINNINRWNTNVAIKRH
jgi:hypothetical protein